jgi:GT2 family glycosyltransferase
MENVDTNVYPLVSMVTINYNGALVTCDLLESLRKISYPNIEILVIDNASSENPDIIKNRYPEVNLIKSNKNLGFAGGNNLGFMAAKGDYIMMINNDTEVHPDFLQPLVSKMQTDPLVGAVSSKLIYYNTASIIQYAGSSPINTFTGRSYFIGSKQQDKGQYDTCSLTHYAHGAAMMISRKVLEEVGLMADLYFLYYEELDFCERIKKAGYHIWFVGNSVVYHKESMSVGKHNPLKTYYLTRNRLVFMRRNFDAPSIMIFMLFFAFASVPKNTILYIKNRQFGLLKAFYKGIIWNIKNRKVDQNIKLTQL